jgi:hypothetical protein
MTEYERFGLIFTKTRVFKFGHQCTSDIRCIQWNLKFFFTVKAFSFEAAPNLKFFKSERFMRKERL